MKTTLSIILCTLLLGTTLAHGATIIVTPGQDLQTALNSANQNDHIKILPGTFSGQYQIVDKNITISKSGGTPNLTKLTLDGGAVTLIGLQIGQIVSSDSSEQNGNHLVHQCEVGNIESNTSSMTVQYSDVGSMVINKNATVTGCTFDGGGSSGVGIKITGANANAVIQNSIIRNYSLLASNSISYKCIGIMVTEGANGIIRNNVIHGCKDRNYEGTETFSGIGIAVLDNSSATITANIIWDCFIADRGNSNIPASSSSGLIRANTSSIIANNILWAKTYSEESRSQLGIDGATGWRVHNQIIGSSNAIGTISSDPKFVNWENGNYQLQSVSPAVNAGPPDPQYNDRDGSRNDIGMFGGHNFIPDGRTTNKPIVLGLDIAPIAVPTGGTVTIESTGATVK
jgi:hypothetical protein